MRVSKIVQVTIKLTPPAVKTLTPPPDKFVATFTRVPSRSQLGEAFEHKVELAIQGLKIDPLDFEPLRAFIRGLPWGPVENCFYQSGMIAVDKNEPLFLP